VEAEQQREGAAALAPELGDGGVGMAAGKHGQVGQREDGGEGWRTPWRARGSGTSSSASGSERGAEMGKPPAAEKSASPDWPRSSNPWAKISRSASSSRSAMRVRKMSS
jgi:hypothetical protein